MLQLAAGSFASSSKGHSIVEYPGDLHYNYVTKQWVKRETAWSVMTRAEAVQLIPQNPIALEAFNYRIGQGYPPGVAALSVLAEEGNFKPTQV